MYRTQPSACSCPNTLCLLFSASFELMWQLLQSQLQ